MCSIIDLICSKMESKLIAVIGNLKIKSSG